MYYVIGPERSADAMAAKFGLRRDEWRRIGSEAGAMLAPVFHEYNRFLVTHDAWQLRDYDQIMALVRDQATMHEQDMAPARV